MLFREAVTIAALVEMLPPIANAKQATGSAARRRSEELLSNSIAEQAGRRNARDLSPVADLRGYCDAASARPLLASP